MLVRCLRRLPRALLLWAMLAPPLVLAQGDPRADDAKAMHLFNFMQFAEWPDAAAGAESPVLCAAGAAPLRGRIGALAGRPAQGRELRVRLGATAADAKDCHALFVAQAEAAHLGALVQATAERPVLVASDIEGSLARGAAIELRSQEDGRVVFAVNRVALAQAKVRLPASVLRLAVQVRE